MCGYFCIGFIDFMLRGKSLPDYTNLFSPNEYEKNDEIIRKYFDKLKEKVEENWFICGKYRKFKNPQILFIFEKIFNL